MIHSSKFFCLLAFLFLLTACAEQDEKSITSNVTDTLEMSEPPTNQLPRDVLPLRYSIELTIEPSEEYFSGDVAIDINLLKPQNGIWMHAQDLEFTEVSIEKNRVVTPIVPEQVSEAGLLRLEFPERLESGAATLRFRYRAKFDTTSHGLHKVVEAGNAYAFTQFESIFARKAFPSFDEPGFKTPFDISLLIPNGDVGISNAPEASSVELESGMRRITFAQSKPLPTYLVAFAVGPLDEVKGADVVPSEHRAKPIPLRAFAVKGKGAELAFALENTAAIVLALDEYFAYPYPYEKLDLIAVPSKGSSAMENAGAITYGEQLILFNEGSQIEQAQGFLNTHAHELAHQWFGNLVTPKWWDDIWLNEAFATWMAATIMDQLYPEDHHLEGLAAGTAYVMTQDSLVTARQIRQPITTEGDIIAAFDGITYVKGGGVLSMFESFMGADAFRKGLRHYMDKHAWGNTDADDFMIALSEVNDEVDSEVLMKSFKSFIEQPGVPMVDVEVNCGENTYLSLSQHRYFPIGSMGASEQLWDIPVCVKVSQQGGVTEHCSMMSSSTHSIPLTDNSCPDFVMPNAEGKSYYRFNLKPQQWDQLLQNFSQLSANEQLSLTSSLSAAFNVAQIDLETYLNAVEVLSQSNSRRVATAPISDLLPVVQYFPEVELLQLRMAANYKPKLDALHKIENKNAEEQQLYNYLLSIVSRFFNDPEWRSMLKAQAIIYTGYGTDNKLHSQDIDVNVRSNALRVASDDLGLPFVKHIWTLIQATDDAALRELMIRAISFSGDPDAAEFVRSLIFDEKLKPEEVDFVLFHQSYYQSNRDAVWKWTQANYDEMLQKVGEESKSQLVSSFAAFCTNAKADEVESFFKSRVDSHNDSGTTLENTLETIRLCASFVSAHNVKKAE
jgi:alanyl aminopeptidase